jgi:hypothetical protein
MIETSRRTIRVLKNSALNRVRSGVPAISVDRTAGFLARRGEKTSARKVAEALARKVNSLASPDEIAKFFDELEAKVPA